MSQLVTLFGGSGFVGRYIAQQLARAGWRVRVAVRRPNEAAFVRPYGVVGQVEPVLCNIRDDASVAQAMSGAEAVVNCVGILNAIGKNTFDAVQNEGAARIARLAQTQGVSKMVHISAIGADAEASSQYARSKAAGEAAVLEHMPNAMILRPSIIFGPEDQFFNRFASMTRLGPILPVVGANTQFQPVYVEDVAKAAVIGVTKGRSGVFELGGPDIESFRDLMIRMLGEIHRKRLIVNIPRGIAMVMGFGFDMLQKLSFGLIPNNMLTRDQVRNLANDNVVGDDDGVGTLDDLGIKATAMEAVLPGYLWRFRPAGQYDAIKQSASNLRSDG